MMSWDDLVDALEDMDPRSPSRPSVIALRDALLSVRQAGAGVDRAPAQAARLLAAVDRAWITQLGQDPDTTTEQIEAIAETCEALRSAHGESALPLHYARVELLVSLGLRNDAIEQLRVARLFSFEQPDTGAVLAAARMHDDYSGVIRTATALATRPEADPVGAARTLGASLLPYLAQGRRVEAEDALASLTALDLPTAERLRALGDQLEYLGMSSQWQRALAVLRHTALDGAAQASAWSLMSTAVGLSLVLREAIRADYGRNALGVALDWRTPWGELTLTAWDTVARSYDQATAFVRALAVRFDHRNGNNGVSHRVETQMAAEASRLAARSYGTVTGPVPPDPAQLRNRPALLAQVRELLTLARGYGMDSVRERAMSTAETVSASLAEVSDDADLELVVDLRLAFARLLAVLGANERAERENLDTAALCESQGWVESACAALALASHAAQARGDRTTAEQAWQACLEQLEAWPPGRPGERCSILTEAVGDPGLSARVLVELAAVLTQGVEQDHSRASIVREVLSRASAQLSRSAHPPRGVAGAIASIEERIAPYGRGRGGRRRGGGAPVTAQDAGRDKAVPARGPRHLA
ncbi:hypothetical protein [Actinomyces capricornis]|uniref:Tetratricopeptide repeat protein n=1 Tax=Actinomyces capricornis TaxID=2755559 RepID=A0ABN6KAP8_9ACTO|nr:hypothetical protein [Actinomyces capricornis]BDA65463.1 hypothetical protein MANAM107_22970 [Actinomyces capricornis]